MFKKLNKKLENSNYLKTDSSILKTLIVLFLSSFAICLTIVLVLSFTVDLSDEYKKMDIIMQNNKTEIKEYLVFDKKGMIYDIEEGYNVSFDKENVSIFSNEKPYIMNQNDNPTIRYTFNKQNDEIIISESYETISPESGYTILLCVLYSFMVAFCTAFFGIFYLAFLYFVILKGIVKKIYLKQKNKMIKDSNKKSRSIRI